MKLAVALIAYKNEEKVITRLERDIVPALSDLWTTEFYCIDNSPLPSYKLKAKSVKNTNFHYIWNEGENWQYSKSLNYVVRETNADYLLYVCTNHGYAVDHTWVNDILKPLQDNEKIAMAGHLVANNHYHTHEQECFKKFPHDMPTQHIQGGVFAAKVDVLKKFPYPEEELPHDYSDIYITAELLLNGYDVASVNTIKSVWRQKVPLNDCLNYKFIHDDDETRRLADKITITKSELYLAVPKDEQ